MSEQRGWKELSPEQFEKIRNEFTGDLREAMKDIAKDVQNSLSFIKSEDEKEMAVHSVLMSIVTVEMSLLFAGYTQQHRDALMEGVFKRMLVLAQMLSEEIKNG